MGYFSDIISHLYDKVLYFLNEASMRRAKEAFKHTYVNEEETYYYVFTRFHFGSMAAFALSLYNLFQIRQRIIKHAIYITRSNKPAIIKPV
jgi:hypothetical protein